MPLQMYHVLLSKCKAPVGGPKKYLYAVPASNADIALDKVFRFHKSLHPDESIGEHFAYPLVHEVVQCSEEWE